MEGQFAFARLPYEVQVKLFQRFLYQQWTVFDQCCVYSNSFSKIYSSMRFPLHVDFIHIQSGKVRIKEEGRPIDECSNLMITANGIFTEDNLDDAICISIMTFMQKAQFIDIKSSFTCSLKAYTSMIKYLGILSVGSRSIGTNVDFTQTDITLDTRLLLENGDNLNEFEKCIGGAFSIESVERELSQIKDRICITEEICDQTSRKWKISTGTAKKSYVSLFYDSRDLSGFIRIVLKKL